MQIKYANICQNIDSICKNMQRKYAKICSKIILKYSKYAKVHILNILHMPAAASTTVPRPTVTSHGAWRRRRTGTGIMSDSERYYCQCQGPVLVTRMFRHGGSLSECPNPLPPA